MNANFECPLLDLGGINGSRLGSILANGVRSPNVRSEVFGRADPTSALKAMAGHPLLRAQKQDDHR